MQNVKMNMQNYLISIQSVQSIDQKNSSIINLNTSNSINNIERQENKIKLKKKHSPIIPNILNSEIKKKQTDKNESQDMISLFEKKITNERIIKFGYRNFHAKTFKRQKELQEAFENKKSFNPRYLKSIIKNFEKKSIEGKTYFKIKRIHLIISIFLLISFISDFIDNTLNKKKSYNIIKECYINNNQYEIILNELKKRKLSKTENFLRGMSVFCSLIMIILLIKKEILIHKNNLLSFSLGKRIKIFIVCSLCFIPYINPIFIINQNNLIYPLFLVDLYYFLSISKIYLVFLLNVDYTLYGNILSQLICMNHSVESGSFFSIRSILKDKPLLTSLILFIIITLIFGFIFRTFEFGNFLINKNPIENNELNLFPIINSFWFVLMSVFNVAYGDYFPRNFFSRIIFIFFLYFGVICLSYLLGNVINYIIMTDSEKKVFLKMKKLYSHENIEFKSVKVIYYVLKLRKEIILYNNNRQEKYVKHLYLKKIICFFLMLNRYIKNFLNNDKIAEEYSIPVDDLLNSVENKINENLIGFETSFRKLDNLGKDLNSLLELQEKINNNMKMNYNEQEILGDFIVEINNLTVFNRLKNQFKSPSNSLYLRNLNTINKTINPVTNKINILNTPSFKRKKKKLKLLLNSPLLQEKTEDIGSENSTRNYCSGSSRLPINVPQKLNLNGGEINYLSQRYVPSGFKTDKNNNK